MVEHAERRQIDDLKNQFARRQESQQTRAYIDAFRLQAVQRHGSIEPGSKIDQWCKWASYQADRLDPLIDAKPSILDISFDEFE